MLKSIKKLFQKNSAIEKEIQLEQKIEKEIIEESEKQLESIKVTGIVIKYIVDDNDIPQIIKISDFHNNIMPDPDSIIWASNGKNLLPYKVIRYDFIEDPDLEKGIASNVYIVVKDALNSDILKNVF